MSKNKTKYPVTFKTVKIDTCTSYSLEELRKFIEKETKEIESSIFNKQYKDITASFEFNYDNCYYEGDTPDVVLEFKGIQL